MPWNYTEASAPVALMIGTPDSKNAAAIRSYYVRNSNSPHILQSLYNLVL